MSPSANRRTATRSKSPLAVRRSTLSGRRFITASSEPAVRSRRRSSSHRQQRRRHRAGSDRRRRGCVGLAGRDRLRPVVLTALTAVLGLVPLTLGSPLLWGPFGWVNICGLVVSIPLSLIVLPACVVLARRAGARLRGLRRELQGA